MRQEVLGIFTNRGVLITEPAGKRILQSENPLEDARRVLESVPESMVFLSLDDVEKVLGVVLLEDEEKLVSCCTPLGKDEDPFENEKTASELSFSSTEEEAQSMSHNIDMSDLPDSFLDFPARNMSSNVNMLLDTSEAGSSSGDIRGFQSYFKDRYFSIREMVRRRRGYAIVTKIGQISHDVSDIKLIGMVKDVSTNKFGDKYVELEDDTGSAKLFISRESKFVHMPLICDEVIGVTCKRAGGRTGLKVEDLVFPEIPTQRQRNTADHDVAVAFCSDIHVGSTTFLGPAWKRMVSSLRGGNGMGDWAGMIKYIVVPGDVVDGIGIFPSQHEELVIDEIDRQYMELAKLMSPIPDHIEILMLPGNHDAVRPAEPQPTFARSIQEMFVDQGVNVRFLGNPSGFNIEGVNVLAYHGRSMDDLVGAIPGLSYEKPLEAMKFMLQKRHLAPIYGGRTPLAPEEKDHLLIEEAPDIFVTGHVHSVGSELHRGVLLVNASTWQSQTIFQKMHNFNPLPAKVPVVNLHDLELRIFDFMEDRVSRTV